MQVPALFDDGWGGGWRDDEFLHLTYPSPEGSPGLPQQQGSGGRQPPSQPEQRGSPEGGTKEGGPPTVWRFARPPPSEASWRDHHTGAVLNLPTRHASAPLPAHALPMLQCAAITLRRCVASPPCPATPSPLVCRPIWRPAVGSWVCHPWWPHRHTTAARVMHPPAPPSSQAVNTGGGATARQAVCCVSCLTESALGFEILAKCWGPLAELALSSAFPV